MGVVGASVYDYIVNRQSDLELSHIVVNNLDKPRKIFRPSGEVDVPQAQVQQYLTSDFSRLLDDPEVSIIVDATNSSDKYLIKDALKHGKSVVTANKHVIANFGNELFSLADRNDLALRVEASVAGEIPVLKNISDYHTAHGISGIEGIVNGTCNYILSRLENEGGSYADAVAAAQRLGFAETPPDTDTKGIDAMNKLAILASIGFQAPLCDSSVLSQIYCDGVEGIHPAAFSLGRAYGNNTIKLIASAKKVDGQIELSVQPTYVLAESELGSCSSEKNCLRVTKDFGGDSYLIGRGAGGEPTAAAMIADVRDIVSYVSNGIKPSNYGDFFKGELPPIANRDGISVRPVIQSSSPEHNKGVFYKKLEVLKDHFSVEQVYNNSSCPHVESTPDFMVLEKTTYGELGRAVQLLEELQCVDTSSVKRYNIAHNEAFDLK